MSGQQFIETLHQIGYPNAKKLDARNFDWMFEDEAALPFLSWFCNTVGHQNIIREKEKESYAELEESGDQILEGLVLEKALGCLSATHGEAVAVETLQDDVEQMKDDLERLHKRKEKLVKARNSLSLHHTGLTHRLARFGDVESAKKHELRRVVEQCHRTNAESNAGLQHLMDSVHRLCNLYVDHGRSEMSGTTEGEAVFLSQLNLDFFHKAEDSYSRELTSFTKKLFFEGVAEIAGELSSYQLLETSDPTALLVKGPSQETFRQDCQELARLQAVFPKSEGERINALVEAKCAVSVSAAADEILRQLQMGQFPTDTRELAREVEETKLVLNLAQDELRQVTEVEVEVLVRQLGSLQGTRVLTGDYRLKLIRQDYFTGNQDQIIKYLAVQQARNELLTMAYEIEARNHRDVNRLLTALENTLQDRLSRYQSRMQAMKDPSMTEAKYDRGTIDTCDTASTRLHRMLVCGGDKVGQQQQQQQQLFLSYSSMVQAAQLLKQTRAHVKAEVTVMADKHGGKVQNLEAEVERCEGVLYAGSSTVGGQPLLMPRQLLETTTQLDDMLHKLEAAVLDIITDVNNKKKALKKEVLQSKERELFIYFHLHPDRLKQTVENLEKRLQAHCVK